MGDRYLRRLLINGMTSQLQSVRRHPDRHPWTTGLLHRKPAKLVAVAMATEAEHRGQESYKTHCIFYINSELRATRRAPALWAITQAMVRKR